MSSQVPNLFLPQTMIKSSEVNENFNSILGALLAATGLDNATWLKDFIMGKRSNMLISGAADSGVQDKWKFMQIGWNANFYHAGGGEWKLTRFNDGESATLLRMGEGTGGFRVMLTSKTSGNLDTQLTTGFAVVAQEAEDGPNYVYIPASWPIVGNESNPQTDDYSDLRVTLTFFDDPPSISSKISTSGGSSTINLYNNGVPEYARGVLINMHIYTGSNPCFYKVFQERSDRDTWRGFGTRIDANTTGGQQGIVPIGKGSSLGKIVFDRSASVKQHTIVILGYYS